MHYSRFFSFLDDEDDGQPRTTATPRSRSFWNNGWCLFIYIYFSSLPWDLVFFFFVTMLQFAIYLRLHETKGNLKIKPQYRCCQSCDANVLVATNFLN